MENNTNTKKLLTTTKIVRMTIRFWFNERDSDRMNSLKENVEI